MANCLQLILSLTLTKTTTTTTTTSTTTRTTISTTIRTRIRTTISTTTSTTISTTTDIESVDSRKKELNCTKGYFDILDSPVPRFSDGEWISGMGNFKIFVKH